MIESYDDFQGETNLPQEAATNLEGSIPFIDLFPSRFMHQYTQFDSIDELLSSGGFEVNSEDDYEAIPDEAIDAHVAKTTNFDSWREMLTNAIEDSYIIERLGL
ncbi:conserved hypothetical protein [Candidatus Desulfosporosinus infrequens]|uniref:Uncharacterized protein n=1 Tax=Candidatus Desulfosporosinus infrequens TaxID=2043169 RepID=A0A2U3LMN3_9FIRM|nr:conserved hypothetical protein [Candidatus Desulfosporosinus infrequens]